MNKLGIRKQLSALLNRNDATDEQLNIFIDQAVGRIQRTLRVPSMERVMVTTVAEDAPNLIVLPNDFLQLKFLYHSTGSIAFSDFSTFQKTVDTPGYLPKIYTRVQGSFLMKPTPPVGTVINMVYYGEIPDLVADTDSNFLSEIAPDLLVYGALVYAADFFIDDRRDKFEQIATNLFNEVQAQADAIEFAQEGMSVNSSFESPEY